MSAPEIMSPFVLALTLCTTCHTRDCPGCEPDPEPDASPCPDCGETSCACPTDPADFNDRDFLHALAEAHRDAWIASLEECLDVPGEWRGTVVCGVAA